MQMRISPKVKKEKNHQVLKVASCASGVTSRNIGSKKALKKYFKKKEIKVDLVS